MPRLGNERHELYARHRAKSMLPAKAAIAAGFATGSSISSKLEEDPEILQRISELMEEFEMKKEQQRIAARESAKTVGQMVGVGKAWVITQLAENAQLARLDGAYKESNDALTKIGEHFGMWGGGGKDPTENKDTVPETVDVDSLDALTRIKEPEAIEQTPEEINDNLRLRALKLIGDNKVKPKDRELTTGSETDAALLPIDEPEQDNENN